MGSSHSREPPKTMKILLDCSFLHTGLKILPQKRRLIVEYLAKNQIPIHSGKSLFFSFSQNAWLIVFGPCS